MEEFRIEDSITYRLEVLLTNCTCENCEDLRLGGYPTYESFAYLGEMMIGSDCCAGSKEDAIHSAEDMYQMFHRGELGYRAEDYFTAEAIEHVRLR
jgi:hypothetical protein